MKKYSYTNPQFNTSIKEITKDLIKKEVTSPVKNGISIPLLRKMADRASIVSFVRDEDFDFFGYCFSFGNTIDFCVAKHTSKNIIRIAIVINKVETKIDVKTEKDVFDLYKKYENEIIAATPEYDRNGSLFKYFDFVDFVRLGNYFTYTLYVRHLRGGCINYVGKFSISKSSCDNLIIRTIDDERIASNMYFVYQQTNIDYDDAVPSVQFESRQEETIWHDMNDLTCPQLSLIKKEDLLDFVNGFLTKANIRLND